MAPVLVPLQLTGVILALQTTGAVGAKVIQPLGMPVQPVPKSVMESRQTTDCPVKNKGTVKGLAFTVTGGCGTPLME
jgi:hypothetical protein